MNLKSATALVTVFLKGDIPAFLWGKPGVGKSQIIRQIAADLGWKVIDFRASTRDPVALMGLPDTGGDTTRWKVPDEFPQVERDGEHGILFLDELNAAAPSMQAAMFGLVLDRKVGDYTLPKGWRVIAAGNRQADGAAAQRMPTALANRFAHIDVDEDVDTTAEHFNKIGVSPIVTAFLRFRPALLHKMARDDRAFPSPRSWEQAAKVVDLPSPLRSQAITAIVGEGAAAEIEGFIRVYHGLPSLDLVLSDPHNTKVPDDVAARFAISTGLARKVDERTFENGMTYIRRIPAREFEILFTTDAVRRDPKLSHTNTFVQWATRNQDVVIN